MAIAGGTYHQILKRAEDSGVVVNIVIRRPKEAEWTASSPSSASAPTKTSRPASPGSAPRAARDRNTPGMVATSRPTATITDATETSR